MQGIQTVNLPQSATILTAIVQDGRIVLYALVDPEADFNERTFAIVPTGGSVFGGVPLYINTVTLIPEPLVYHVFEIV